jgi:hypothetical protein
MPNHGANKDPINPAPAKIANAFGIVFRQVINVLNSNDEHDCG